MVLHPIGDHGAKASKAGNLSIGFPGKKGDHLRVFSVIFDPQEMVVSQRLLNGDHWVDWLATSCPALLISGLESKLTPQSHFEQMAARRPNTRLESPLRADTSSTSITRRASTRR